MIAEEMTKTDYKTKRAEAARRAAARMADKLSSRQRNKLAKQTYGQTENDFVGFLQPIRRFRPQKGQVLKYRSGWVVRYTKIDDSGDRVKVFEKIPVSPEAEKPEATFAARPIMKRVNASVHTSVLYTQGEIDARDISIGKFFDDDYSDYVLSIASGLRRSTADKHCQMFETYCRKEIGDMSLRNFDDAKGDAFLRKLASRGLGRSLVARVKVIMSGLFKRAKLCKRVDSNIWRDVSVKVQKEPREKREYSIEERDAILALKDLSTEAKALFALITVAALRPSEAAGLRWERIDFRKCIMQIREGAASGRLGELKTPRSRRDLLIAEPLLGYLKAWHAECAATRIGATGLLFTRKQGANKGAPIKTNDFARNHIEPIIDEWNSVVELVEKGDANELKKLPPERLAEVKRWLSKHSAQSPIVWKALYAGRHGGAKAAWEQSRDVLKVAAFQGNTPQTVFNSYLRGRPDEVIAMQRAMEKAQNGKRKRRA